MDVKYLGYLLLCVIKIFHVTMGPIYIPAPYHYVLAKKNTNSLIAKSGNPRSFRFNFFLMWLLLVLSVGCKKQR